MIFVTVGQMLGFDRLIRAMDNWAAEHPEEEVFAQIGDGAYKPEFMKWVDMLKSCEFKSTVANAEVICAHAGMGSFFVSTENGKPLVMLPRKVELKEHTTDHQVHTLRWLRQKPSVFAADTEAELPAAIARARASTRSSNHFERFAPAPFIVRLREAILN